MSRDRESLIDVHDLSDRDILIRVHDRQLEDHQLLCGHTLTLYGEDGRTGVVGDVIGLMAWRNRSMPPTAVMRLQQTKWQVIGGIIIAVVGLLGGGYAGHQLFGTASAAQPAPSRHR